MLGGVIVLDEAIRLDKGHLRLCQSDVCSNPDRLP
jgi:hypothetical protein